MSTTGSNYSGLTPLPEADADLYRRHLPKKVMDAHDTFRALDERLTMAMMRVGEAEHGLEAAKRRALEDHADRLMKDPDADAGPKAQEAVAAAQQDLAAAKESVAGLERAFLRAQLQAFGSLADVDKDSLADELVERGAIARDEYRDLITQAASALTRANMLAEAAIVWRKWPRGLEDADRFLVDRSDLDRVSGQLSGDLLRKLEHAERDQPDTPEAA